MSGEDIRVYTAEELEAMRRRGETKTDWGRLRTTTEEELEQSIADDPDWRDLVVDWDEATSLPPERQEVVTLSIPHDLVEWFRHKATTTKAG